MQDQPILRNSYRSITEILINILRKFIEKIFNLKILKIPIVRSITVQFEKPKNICNFYIHI